MEERLVMCDEEDTDGRARVTRDDSYTIQIAFGIPLISQQNRHEISLQNEQRN